MCLHPLEDNLQELVLQFHDTLRALLDRHVPDKRKQIHARPSAPWMTDEIMYAKRKKRRAERRWRASKTPTNLALFRSQRNRVTYLMNKDRQEYYRSFIDDISNDQRKLFKASKSLLNLAEGPNFPPCTDYQVLANEFFVRKIAIVLAGRTAFGIPARNPEGPQSKLPTRMKMHRQLTRFVSCLLDNSGTIEEETQKPQSYIHFF